MWKHLGKRRPDPQVPVCFFGANISKIFHGAWFPLVIGAVFFTLMLTWRRGRELLGAELADLTPSFEEFSTGLKDDPPEKIRGQAILLTGRPDKVPAALVHNRTHNKVLHSDTVLLHIRTEDIPRVPNSEKVDVERLGGGFSRITAHYGFMEEPKIDNILALSREQGLEIKAEEASFFLGREKLSMGEKPRMRPWRSSLFSFMSRNAMDSSSFFGIPPDRIIEVGVRLEL